MRSVLVVVMLGLAACQPAAVEQVEETPVAPLPEQPVMQARAATFEAMSTTAQAFTGAITLSAEPRASADAPPSMKLAAANGLTFVTELIPGGAEQATKVDWKALFGSEVVVSGNPPPGAPSVDVHAVIKEDVPNTATNGGYCGPAPTGYIAMATGLEVQGQQVMSIAAFEGDVWPPANETDLCGTFNYAPPAPQ
jgi:hypothetical protein